MLNRWNIIVCMLLDPPWRDSDAAVQTIWQENGICSNRLHKVDMAFVVSGCHC